MNKAQLALQEQINLIDKKIESIHQELDVARQTILTGETKILELDIEKDYYLRAINQLKGLDR